MYLYYFELKVNDMKRSSFEMVNCSVFYISPNTTYLYLVVEDGLSDCRGVSRMWLSSSFEKRYETKILSLYLSSASNNIHIKEMCTCFVEEFIGHEVDSKVFFFMYE